MIRLDPRSDIPAWIYKSPFFSISKTPEELSLVCESAAVPGGDLKTEDNWKCLQVLGPLDFSLTGVLSSIARPLADAKISIFALSTFDTDYVMVKQDCLDRAKDALRQAGFEIDP